jgi:hypothetical protein
MLFTFILHQFFWLMHSERALITGYARGYAYRNLQYRRQIVLINGSIRLINQSIRSQKRSIDWPVPLQAIRLIIFWIDPSIDSDRDQIGNTDKNNLLLHQSSTLIEPTTIRDTLPRSAIYVNNKYITPLCIIRTSYYSQCRHNSNQH